jgi:hypothetical protein
MWNWLARSTLLVTAGTDLIQQCDAPSADSSRRCSFDIGSRVDGRACRTQRIAVCRWRSYGVSK